MQEFDLVAANGSFTMDGKPVSPKGLQHELWCKKASRVAELFVNKLDGNLRKLVMSANNEAANSLVTSFPIPSLRLSDEELRTLLLLKCAQSAAPAIRTLLGTDCPVCQQPIAEGHERVCTVSRKQAGARHAAIKRIVYQMTLAVPTALAVMERRMDAGNGDVKQPDVVAVLPTADDLSQVSEHYVDTTIGEVTAPSYDARAAKNEVPHLLEEMKQASYRNWCQAQRGKLWPFGMSTVGQLGPVATNYIKLLEKVCAKSKKRFPRRYWLSRLGRECVRYLVILSNKWARAASLRHSSVRAAMLFPTGDDHRLVGSRV